MSASLVILHIHLPEARVKEALYSINVENASQLTAQQKLIIFFVVALTYYRDEEKNGFRSDFWLSASRGSRGKETGSHSELVRLVHNTIRLDS